MELITHTIKPADWPDPYEDRYKLIQGLEIDTWLAWWAVQYGGLPRWVLMNHRDFAIYCEGQLQPYTLTEVRREDGVRVTWAGNTLRGTMSLGPIEEGKCR